MTDFLVREIEAAQDTPGILKLDTSFSSNRVFEVGLLNDDAMHLKLVEAPKTITWRFPLRLDADPWQYGWVASRHTEIVGFIATAYSAWNRRLTIWHYYVDQPHRRLGIGRALMKHAIKHGRELGAETVWLETSNLNGTGVDIYRKIGFHICGFDLTLYNGTPSQGQFAIFLTRSIDTKE